MSEFESDEFREWVRSVVDRAPPLSEEKLKFLIEVFDSREVA